MSSSGISSSFLELSRSSGQVTHVLRTRSRLCPRASPGSSLHLHVLSTPPAFVLSQDQTLREELHVELSWSLCRSSLVGEDQTAGTYTPWSRTITGDCYFPTSLNLSANRMR